MRILGIAIFLIGLLASGPIAQAEPMTVTLKFVTFSQAKMNEQDIFVEKAASSGQVYRVTPEDTNMGAWLFATAKPQDHNPADAKAIGPFQKGRALGITLGQWLGATGNGTYTCNSGEGTVQASFAKLVSNGLYTMWNVFAPAPPAQPFRVLELPLGARDGTQNTFRADAQGNASFAATFKPCLQLTGDHLVSMLAIAWHSDGKTYAGDAGPFGMTSHVQMLVRLPRAEGQ